ncbi:MAG TPA: SCO family protein [Chthoniobacteraceae bacterium]|nr:SCO family protein [Chthoniobacteraceae bacterium]
MKSIATILSCLFFATRFAVAEIPDATLRQVVFEQKPGAQVSGALQFRDEAGRLVKLSDYLGDKPVILIPGYYRCPMLCTLVLNGAVEAMQDLPKSIGKDFVVVNFSIDPAETPQLAAAKKANYLRQYGRPGADAGWHFLTGDEPAIRQLCDEIGFHYAYDPQIGQFAHPSGFVVLTPDGKITRYFFGVNFSGKELDASLTAAASNHVEPGIRQLFLLCFHYSPITGKYGGLIVNITRVLGIATVLAIAAFILRAARRPRKT